MIQVLTRQEFVSYFQKLLSKEKGPLPNEHPLFIPERAFDVRCEWFVEILPIPVYNPKNVFFDWCKDHLKGHVLCFSSGTTEWWGFTDYDDIAMWILRWA